jgi:hypothetical protein
MVKAGSLNIAFNAREVVVRFIKRVSSKKNKVFYGIGRRIATKCNRVARGSETALALVKPDVRISRIRLT